MLHDCRGHPFVGVVGPGVPFTWGTVIMVLPRAVPGPVAILLVLLCVGSLHSAPVCRACSVCGGQCQVGNGAEAQVPLCRQG